MNATVIWVSVGYNFLWFTVAGFFLTGSPLFYGALILASYLVFAVSIAGIDTSIWARIGANRIGATVLYLVIWVPFFYASSQVITLAKVEDAQPSGIISGVVMFLSITIQEELQKFFSKLHTFLILFGTFLIGLSLGSSVKLLLT